MLIAPAIVLLLPAVLTWGLAALRKTKLRLTAWATVVVGSAAAALALWMSGPAPGAATFWLVVIVTSLAVVAAVWDSEYGIIPDEVSILTFTVAIFAVLTTGAWIALGWALVAFLVLIILSESGQTGGGDVKFLPWLGLTIATMVPAHPEELLAGFSGLVAVWMFLMAMSVLGLGWALVTRDRFVPMAAVALPAFLIGLALA